MNKVITGLEHLLQNPQPYLRGNRIGLVINHTSIDSQGRLSTEQFQSAPEIELTKLFAPEHGLYGVDQDMMMPFARIDTLFGRLDGHAVGHQADFDGITDAGTVGRLTDGDRHGPGQGRPGTQQQHENHNNQF